MKTIILQDITHNNLGDIISNPAFYYNLPNPVTVDIRNPEVVEHDENDLLVLGAGGLIREDFLDALCVTLPHYKCKKMTIAVGHNFDDPSYAGKYPDILSHFDVVGVRDYEFDTALKLFNYSPCPTCLHPEFDKLRQIEKTDELFIYSHKDFGLKGDMTNKAENNPEDTFKDVLGHMARAKAVITNCYHGGLWATWLNCKVVVIPAASRFLYYSHPPTYAKNLIEAKNQVALARSYPQALEFERFYARDMQRHINDLVNDNLTVGYSISSRNLGDNLTWFAQVLRHMKEHKHIKRAYVKSKWKELFEDSLGEDVSFKRATDRIYNRFYNLTCAAVPDWRQKNVELIASEMLGLEPKHNRYDLSHLAKNKPLNCDYLTYTSYGSWTWKAWQYKDERGNGWDILKGLVKEKYGMEMIDCSLEAEEIPKDIISGALTYIHHSRAFIGGPSGLAWLAYYVGKKPILISGVTRIGTEMPDCLEIRVDDKEGCKHCYHNAQPFPAFNRCATNKDYECWQKITPEMVMEKIIEIMDVG